MSKRKRRWVPPGTLDTPEQGAEPLTTPEAGVTLEEREEGDATEDEAEDDVPEPVYGSKVEPPTPAAGVSERERRLADAVALPPPASADDRPAWVSGRDAAVADLKAGASADAMRKRPVPAALDCGDCRACWLKGRDAVLDLVARG
jgi:hypothetical protein